MRSILFALSAATLTACSAPQPESTAPAEEPAAPELAPEGDADPLVDRVNELESRLAAAEADAQGAIAALQNAALSLERTAADVNAIQDHIDTMDSLLVTQDARIGDAEQSVASLQDSSATHGNRLTHLNDRADKLELQAATFDATDTDLQNRIADLQLADAAFTVVDDRYASFFTDHNRRLVTQADALTKVDQHNAAQEQAIDEVMQQASAFEARIAAEERETPVIEQVDPDPSRICLVGPKHEQVGYLQLPEVDADQPVILRTGPESFLVRPTSVECGADGSPNVGPIVEFKGEVFVDPSFVDDDSERSPSSASWAVVRSR